MKRTEQGSGEKPDAAPAEGPAKPAEEYTGRSLQGLSGVLGVSRATYYRWQARQAAQSLQDRIVTPRRRALWPTAAEVQAVCAFALTEPAMGYKRLTWRMVDSGVA